MYKCLTCGNEDKFYGIVKEQGNALIFQNARSTAKPAPERKLSAVAVRESSPLKAGPDNTVRCNLWAIQNSGKNDDVTWAYLVSEGSWEGFHEIRSCAVCRSSDIVYIQ